MSACRRLPYRTAVSCRARSDAPRSGGPRGELGSLAEIVVAYLERDWIRGVDELAYFGERDQSPAEAIDRAALSRLRSGAMHPHQYRVGSAACAELAVSLADHVDLIAEAPDFDSIHTSIQRGALGVRRVGELTIYDVAQRIGAYRGHRPERVYLHRGTREGGRALGLDVDRPSIGVDELPPELRGLSATQLEDLLCLYKADLKRLGPVT